MDKKERAEAFYDILEQLYPDALCSLEYETPLQLLIATQLANRGVDIKLGGGRFFDSESINPVT